MIYMAPAKRKPEGSQFGYIASPHGQVGADNLTIPWCCDNQVFTKKFNNRRFFDWLRRVLPWRKWNVFVVCPDVVGDCDATARQWPHFSGAISALGYTPAYAAQDGMTPDAIPEDARALFVGGSDEWKLHPPCVEIIRAAQARGMWVHVGRVNSLDRIGHCRALGVNSVDGTYPIYAPDQNWPKLQAKLSQGVLL